MGIIYGCLFNCLYDNGMLSVIRIASMSTHNIYFHDKIRKQIPKISLNNYFLWNYHNFLGTQKRVRISHGKRAIDVRVIEVLLYL